MDFSRRSFLFTAAASLLPGEEMPKDWQWIQSCRCLIAEAYNPPFYPKLDYKPEKAIEVCKSLNADSLRYPAASYYAYFPTKTKYPVHPELHGDPFRDTVDQARKAGLKVIAYVPLNHPFMQVKDNNPLYDDWVKRFADGKPMMTEHYGFTRYYEGCLNSPVRDQIRAMVREILLNYKPDVMYFDGPYMGMQHARDYCQCQYCRKAYGKPIPAQEDPAYHNWMANDVVIAFLREIREMIRKEHDVPVLFNDTSLLSRREWRNRAIPVVDGFMFEAAETPEEKLFNLSLGHSTGKTIWTYVGTHTQYNREHMKNERVRGWFSYPVESEELLLDGAVALAGNAGLKYWGLSRFFYMPKQATEYPSGRAVREVFDVAAKHRELWSRAEAPTLAGVLVGSQTIDWYKGKLFVSNAYANAYRGAFQVLKELSYDVEPFLDYRLTADSLKKYKLVYIPNAPCLSDAQCAAIREYVKSGGAVVATHLTSTCDEYGVPRKDFALADLFGAHYKNAVEIPDLYLHGDFEEVPQDPQITQFEATGEVIARTIERGEHSRDIGPAIVKNGRVLYIGSSLESIYEETRMSQVRDFLGSLIQPMAGEYRRYDVPPRPGLLAHFTIAGNSDLLLHLIADTGNKSKKLRMREEFLPIPDVQARIKLPQGRRLKSVSSLRSGKSLPHTVKDGWIDLKLPSVYIHEAVRVELA